MVALATYECDTPSTRSRRLWKMFRSTVPCDVKRCETRREAAASACLSVTRARRNRGRERMIQHEPHIRCAACAAADPEAMHLSACVRHNLNKRHRYGRPSQADRSARLPVSPPGHGGWIDACFASGGDSPPSNTPIGATYSGSRVMSNLRGQTIRSLLCDQDMAVTAFGLGSYQTTADSPYGAVARLPASRRRHTSLKPQPDETVLRRQPHTAKHDGYATGTSTDVTTDETRTCGAVQPARACRQVAQRPGRRQ